MSEFKNVTVVKKANVYFEGKVISRSVLFPDGTKKTLGIMLPGEYEFGTDDKEVMEILSGDLDISLAAVDFADISTGPVGLSGIAYIFATYGTLTGSQFASVVDLPAGYTLDYAYGGNNIALVPEPTAALLGALGLLGLLRRRRA